MAVNKILLMNQGYLASQENGTIFAAESQFLINNATDLYDICVDNNGNIYATDPTNHIVVKVTSQNKVISFAGKAGESGKNGDVPVSGRDARFNSPKGIDCDKSGNLYVADTGNNQIRRISKDGRVSVLAGDINGIAGYKDGLQGRLNGPQDVSVLGESIYVADTNNHALRITRLGLQGVYTLAGNGVAGDGIFKSAQFNAPTSLAVTPNGKIYINDSKNNKIKLFNNRGDLVNFAGGTRGNEFGQGSSAQFYDLQFIVSDGKEGAYLVDYDRSIGSRLLYIDALGKNHLVHAFENLPVAGLASDSNDKIYVCVTDEREDLYDIGRLIIGDSVFGIIQ